MFQYLWEFWQYLKDNDAPNWFVIFFSLIFWPGCSFLLTYWWAHRKRQSFPKFLVTLNPFLMTIGAAPYDAVLLTYINQTGSIVYLSHARLREVQKNFPVAQIASRDAQGWREQTFALPTNPAGSFDHYECILQTDVLNGRVCSAIAVKHPMDGAFYSYRPTMLRKWFGFPKYFLLEYTIVVGEKKVSIATVY